MSAGFGAAVAGRLYELDSVAAGLVVRSAADVARVQVELEGLVGRWRWLLVAHTADGGRCGVCRSWWRARRWPCPVWRAAYRSLLECVAVDGADVPVAVGSSDPGPSTAARGDPTARGRVGVATIPSPRPGGRSPRPARPGPRHRIGTGPPVAWGASVALVVFMAVVVLVALVALVPIWLVW